MEKFDVYVCAINAYDACGTKNVRVTYTDNQKHTHTEFYTDVWPAVYTYIRAWRKGYEVWMMPA